MLTDHEKNLVRMMVVNTTPEYMEEVRAMDDDTVRPLIAEFVTRQMQMVDDGLRFHGEQLVHHQSEVDRLTTLKSTLEES